jgi:hypothetical protein
MIPQHSILCFLTFFNLIHTNLIDFNLTKRFNPAFFTVFAIPTDRRRSAITVLIYRQERDKFDAVKYTHKITYVAGLRFLVGDIELLRSSLISLSSRKTVSAVGICG